MTIDDDNMMQDLESTMQKTGLTKYSYFLFWPGLGKGITYSCNHYGAANDNFLVYWAIFGMVTNDRPNNQVILVQACP